MEREKPSASAERTLRATRRATALAEKQGGRITHAQLRRCGLHEGQIQRWNQSARLTRITHGLYVLGPRIDTKASPLQEALLIAGEGSALSHGTSLWWRGLIRFPPRDIHVCAFGRARSRAGLVIHHPRRIEREWHRGLPLVPLGESLLGAAATTSFGGLRRALALIDHRGEMTLEELEALVGGGKPGSRTIRDALRIHMPELARTRSSLEERFLFFCEKFGFELPMPNYEVAGYEVDAVWPALRIAVELDGREEHGTPAAVVVDRRREQAIRGAGYDLVRYGSEQIDHAPIETANDLLALMDRNRLLPSVSA